MGEIVIPQEPYTVQPGDTWESIAARMGLSVDVLKGANHVYNTTLILELGADAAQPPAGVELSIPIIPEGVEVEVVRNFSGNISGLNASLPSVESTPETVEYTPEVVGYRDAGQYHYITAATTLTSTDKVLLEWWVSTGAGTAENYNREQAEQAYIDQFSDELMTIQHSVRTAISEGYANLPEGWEQNPALAQYVNLDFSNIADMNDFISKADMGPDELAQLYLQIAQLNPEYIYINPEYLADAQAYQIAQAYETGAESPIDPYANYQSDLAMATYFKEMVGGTDPEALKAYFLDYCVQLLANSQGLAGSELSPQDRLNESVIKDYIESELGTDFDLEDLIAFSNNLAQEHQDNFQGVWEPGEDVSWENEEQAAFLLENTAAYYDAQALDELRQIVYDPNWDPERDKQLFVELDAAIKAAPRAILGVDVGFVQDSFRAYYTVMKNFHDWRLKLKPEIDRIEAEMAQADEEQTPLWWLSEMVLSILFEPLDWLFTARDLLVYGDATALIGLLPLVPSALRNVKYAAQGLSTLPDLARNLPRGLLQQVRSMAGQVDEAWPIVKYMDELPPGPAVNFKTLPGAFETVDDAVEWMAEHYPRIQFDPKGVDVVAISQAVDQFHYLSQRWPGVSRRLRGVGTDQTSLSRIPHMFQDVPNAAALMSTDGRWLGLSTSKAAFGNRKFANERFGLGGQFVAVNARGDITHEFAHGIITDLREGTTRSRNLIDEFLVEDNLATSVLSEYATINPKESFAEGVVAIYHIPRENWPEYVKRQFDFLVEVTGTDSWWR